MIFNGQVLKLQVDVPVKVLTEEKGPEPEQVAHVSGAPNAKPLPRSQCPLLEFAISLALDGLFIVVEATSKRPTNLRTSGSL